MKKIDIGVFSIARVSSSRCENKMTRPFADRTLSDIAIERLSKVEANVFFAGYESYFKNTCQSYNVPFVQRTKESALSNGPVSEVFSFILDQPYEYFLLVSACFPFLRPESVTSFIDICLKDDRPKFAVLRKNNYFTDIGGEPYNFEMGKMLDTKTISPIYEFAHVFYFFKKSHLVDNGTFWDWNDVRYIEIDDNMEAFDIDTEEQFQMAEAMWKGLNSKRQ